jgi:hypothetical protein
MRSAARIKSSSSEIFAIKQEKNATHVSRRNELDNSMHDRTKKYAANYSASRSRAL